MNRMMIVLLAAAVALPCTEILAQNSKVGLPKQVVNLKAKAVQSFPHDTKAYTQGLFFWNGELYETTGQYGQSSVRRVDLKSGKVLQEKTLTAKYFGEGSCVVDGKLYMLTWTNKVAFIYDAATLKYQKAVSYPREGWGLTALPKNFAAPKGVLTDSNAAGKAVMVASDGTSQLFYLDGEFNTVGVINVTFNGKALPSLNELEWIDGRIWANVYMTDYVVVINPGSGRVERLIDCSELIPMKQRTPSMDVLNGIAVGADGSVYLTGKNWPLLFKVEFVPNN